MSTVMRTIAPPVTERRCAVFILRFWLPECPGRATERSAQRCVRQTCVADRVALSLLSVGVI
eukprot:440922-Prymnesium_polylepis.1